MPMYDVVITQTYRGEFWAKNEKELLESVDASALTFDSEEVEEYQERESN